MLNQPASSNHSLLTSKSSLMIKKKMSSVAAVHNYKYLSVGTLAMTGQFSQLYFIVHPAKFNCLN